MLELYTCMKQKLSHASKNFFESLIIFISVNSWIFKMLRAFPVKTYHVICISFCCNGASNMQNYFECTRINAKENPKSLIVKQPLILNTKS